AVRGDGRGDRGGHRQRTGRGRDDDRPRRQYGPSPAPRPPGRDHAGARPAAGLATAAAVEVVATRCDKPHHRPVLPIGSLFDAESVGALGLIGTALVLGVRHGFDWDHLAAITDVTSTTATADHAELDHEADHAGPAAHEHSHGGATE